MFALFDPETAALERLRRRDGWTPPDPDVVAAADEFPGDDDPRWEDFVQRWEQDDYPDYQFQDGDDQ